MTVPGAPLVRVATLADTEAVAAVTLAAYGPLGWQSTDAYWTTLADAGPRIERGAVLVAEDAASGQVVGAVALSTVTNGLFEHDPRDGDAGFRMLAVHPDARRRGVGLALVEAAIARLRDAGARRLLITTMDFMPAAQAMYASLGFVRRPDLDVRYPRGHGMACALDLADVRDLRPPGPVPDEPRWYLDPPSDGGPPSADPHACA